MSSIGEKLRVAIGSAVECPGCGEVVSTRDVEVSRLDTRAANWHDGEILHTYHHEECGERWEETVVVYGTSYWPT